LDPQGAGVDAAAARLAAANPQAVLLATDTPLAVRFIPALREQRSFALVVTSSGVDARALVSQLPPPSAIWLATADLLPKVDDPRHGEALVAEYRELQARYGAAGPFIAPAALEGFIAAKVLIEAVRRADGRPTPAAVRTALANLADFNVGAGSVSFRNPAQSGLAYARISLLMPR
jgi:ABC-type branched-subunit amino acid transport system substrate-binding protein